MKLHQGNNLAILKTLESNSIDAVVTDPPYGLSFMNKKWDYDVPSVEFWQEVLRVLKPGGHVLSFGGTRTYHRMVVNIEDAGFEIRDQVMWIYGSGFPKSHNISKAIDKMKGAEREVVGSFKATGTARNSKHIGAKTHAAMGEYEVNVDRIYQTAAATPEAKQWDGFGTALKPANEPICLARKPLEKGLSIAENVLKYGTGAINIDGCRIEAQDQVTLDAAVKRMTGNAAVGWKNTSSEGIKPNASQGRWPANIMFDESAAETLPIENKKPVSRYFYCAKTSKRERNAGLDISYLVWDKDTWEKQDLKSARMAMLELVKDISEDILMDDSSWSTDIYGHSISEQYPTGMIFTIETVLKLIIELKTLSASQNLSIKESIQNAIRTIEVNGLSLAESVQFINQLELNTISEKTASLLGVVRAVLPMLLKIRKSAVTGNFHSTVKPIKLMEYLITLITPPNGTVLDPFMGSGSTGVAAKNLGFDFIGMELDEEYFKIAEKRIGEINATI